MPVPMELRFSGFGFSIWREKPGAISEGVVWVAYHQGYMYIADTFWQLIKLMVKEWQHDRHIIG